MIDWEDKILGLKQQTLTLTAQSNSFLINIYDQSSSSIGQRYLKLVSPYFIQKTQQYDINALKQDYRINTVFRNKYFHFVKKVLQQQQKLANQTVSQTTDLMSNIYRETLHCVIGRQLNDVDEANIKRKIAIPWTHDGIHYETRISKNTNKLFKQTQDILIDGVRKGENPITTRKKIARRFEVQKHQAQRTIRTEGIAYFNDALYTTFVQIGATRYKVMGAAECGMYCPSGEIFDMSQWSEGLTAPPFHPDCQCYVVPLFD